MSRRKWPRRLALCLLALCALLLAAWVFRAPILRGAARAWIVNEPPAHADAVVVLGGGIYTRPFEAARLYASGFAKKILIMDVKPTSTDELGFTLPEPELTKLILTRKGVPTDAVQVLGTNVTSTHEEALAVADWVKKTGAEKILITTDLFPTRRVRWIFRKTLKPTGAQVWVEAHNMPSYSASNWWQCEEGLITFQNEVVKFAYYFVKY